MNYGGNTDSENSSLTEFEYCIGSRRCLRITFESLSLVPCMIRVPTVFHPWPRILISQLASIFVAGIRGVNVILRLCIDLRLIAIGFDLRFFHAELARGTLTSAPGCHHTAARQNLHLREPL